MKRILTSIVLIFNLNIYSQITLEKTLIDTDELFIYNEENETIYFSHLNNKLKMYNESYELIKEITFPSNVGYDNYDSENRINAFNLNDESSNFVISRKIVNDDDLFEFSTYTNNNGLIIFNENGEIIKEFIPIGTNLYSKAFYYFHDKKENKNKLIVSINDSNYSDEKEFEIYSLPTNSSLSINEINNLNKNLKGYPNPTKNVFNLKNPNNGSKKIEVFDLNGKKVITQKINEFEENIRINMRNLTNGVYIYKIGNFNSKLIKE